MSLINGLLAIEVMRVIEGLGMDSEAVPLGIISGGTGSSRALEGTDADGFGTSWTKHHLSLESATTQGPRTCTFTFAGRRCCGTIDRSWHCATASDKRCCPFERLSSGQATGRWRHDYKLSAVLFDPGHPSEISMMCSLGPNSISLLKNLRLQ
jgi:hypothetical protein